MNTRVCKSLLILFFLTTVTTESIVNADEFVKIAVAEPIRALLVTGGCCHDYDRQKLILTRGISARANVRWTVVHQGGKATDTPIPLYNDPDWAEGFDIVVHNECFSDVKDLEFVDRILQPHKDGLPAILIHCAMHCYRVEDNRWFKFVGMQSPGHGPHYSYKADNLKTQHPIMEGFGPAFIAPKGELYHSMKVFPTATPLAQANRQADGEPQVCVWTNDYNNGTKVFGCTMGHYNETMAEPKYLDMMARALLWATDRDIEKEFTPSTAQIDEDIKALIAAPVEKPSANNALPGNCCGDDNLALGKTVTSKSEQNGNFRKHLTDGRLNTRFCPNRAQGNEWVTVDLGEAQFVRNIRLHWERRTGTAYRYTVEASPDGETWKTVVDESKNEDTNGVRAHTIEASNTRYLKTTFLSSSTRGWGSIWELEATAGELPELSDQVLAADSPPPSVSDVKTPPGFATTMFGAPPEVNYPVCLTTAATGEVFVGVDEMGSLGKEPGRGKVLRCVDTDGDGKADQINEFAKMDHPRGLIFESGTSEPDRLWVLHPPFLSVFHDRDGDGTADDSEVLIEGISTEQVAKRGADHTTNGIRRGIDGWIYIAVGDFGFVKAHAPKDGRTLSRRGGGIVRIRPDGSEMEIYSWGQRNILDVSIDPFMNIFTRDNTNDGGGWDIRVSHIQQSADYGYPSLYRNFSEEIMPPLADYGGGSGCGSMYFHDARWPKAFQNLLLTCDWGTSKVYSHALPTNGATFDPQQDVFLSLPRPTDIDVDASGRMYVSSWKNGKFAYDGPNIGFVAQVVPADFVPKPVPNFVSMTDEELVAQLKNPSAAWREHAQQQIQQRYGFRAQIASSLKFGDLAIAINPADLGLDKEAVAQLEAARKLRDANTKSEPGDDKPELKAEDISTAVQALAADSDAPLYARVAAVYTLKNIVGAGANSILAELSKDPLVRESCLRALADRRSQFDGIQWAPMVDGLNDRNPRVQATAIIGIGRVLGHALEHNFIVADSDGRRPAAELRESIAATLLSLTAIQNNSGKPEAKNTEQKPVHADDWRNPHPERVLPHLAVKSLVQINATKECVAALNGPYRAGALWALKYMHNTETVDGLFKVLSTSRDESLRHAVWTTLIRLYNREGEYKGDWWGTRPDTTGPFYDRKTWSESPRIAAAVKVALAEGDKALAEHIKTQLKRHLVHIEGISGSEVVVASEPEAKIELPKADPNNPNIIANLSYSQVFDRVKNTSGDVEKGKKFFKTQSCVSCHTFANGQLPKGPHLVDIGKRYKKEELIESIVDPSKKIAQGFDTWSFVMESGKVHTGFVVLESAETVRVRKADGLSLELLKDDIEERVKQTVSMMPKGVVSNLTCEQLADLIAYLQSLH